VHWAQPITCFVRANVVFDFQCKIVLQMEVFPATIQYVLFLDSSVLLLLMAVKKLNPLQCFSPVRH
jgi:hypothetical protein